MPACCSVLASPRHPASWGCLLATLKSRQQPVWLTEPSLAQLAGRKAGGQGKVWWVWAGWQDWAVRPVLTYLYTVIQVIQHSNSNRTTSGVQHTTGAAPHSALGTFQTHKDRSTGQFSGHLTTENSLSDFRIPTLALRAAETAQCFDWRMTGTSAEVALW